MNTIILIALLFQNVDYVPALNSSADTQRREAELRQVVSLPNRPTPSAVEENGKAYAAGRDREFVGKFNKLITSLMDFADSYKDGKAIDIKKAQAVRKAWVELEKSEAIFQGDNPQRERGDGGLRAKTSPR
jgi:hypothetical protein